MMKMCQQQQGGAETHDASPRRPPRIAMVVMPLMFLAPVFVLLSVYGRLGRIERLLKDVRA